MTAQLEERLEAVEAMASASTGRQDILAGNLTEVRDDVRQIKDRVEWLVERVETGQGHMQTWQNITDQRLEHVEDDILEIKGGITKLNKKYDGLRKEVNDLNTRYERLDNKVDALNRGYKALDGKVGVLTQEVSGLKAGQIELRDMVAILLARSEGVAQHN